MGASRESRSNMEFQWLQLNIVSTDELASFKDYYKILEVDYDATDEKIRLNYRKLALKWHPDKHNGDSAVTAKFQEINEAYAVLSDPDKRLDYDFTGIYEIDKYTLRKLEYRDVKSLYHISGAAGDGTDQFAKYFINTLQIRIIQHYSAPWYPSKNLDAHGVAVKFSLLNNSIFTASQSSL
ncbi:J domain-containing protein [Citrus sinensis]|uniref:J domain-containing protein n=1 Tax=Citrus sinensis TaxID=2711 RepID=A0ACB8LCX8_CITSI|nr:J domain-containing protein [Citrus sinensis]